MTISNELAEKLTLTYLEKTCDIYSMSVEEYTKKFIEVYSELSKSLNENKPKNKVYL